MRGNYSVQAVGQKEEEAIPLSYARCTAQTLSGLDKTLHNGEGYILSSALLTSSWNTLIGMFNQVVWASSMQSNTYVIYLCASITGLPNVLNDEAVPFAIPGQLADCKRFLCFYLGACINVCTCGHQKRALDAWEPELLLVVSAQRCWEWDSCPPQELQALLPTEPFPSSWKSFLKYLQ